MEFFNRLLESLVMDGGASPDPSMTSAGSAAKRLPNMLFPSEYVWLVFVSSLDIMLTWAILRRGGTEVNPIAALIIDRWGLAGSIGFKFSIMLFVILVCEHIGRHQHGTARWLSRVAVVVSAIPPVWSIGLLGYHIWFEMD